MTEGTEVKRFSRQSMTGAKGIIECLKREKVENVFCVPGESYLPVMDAIRGEPSIQLISNRHESGAAFMAEGYAKASGKTGVVMATRGVGASNLTIGVHTAYQDSTPMVVFLGQVHSKFRGREGFQEVDLDQFFQPIAKWTFEIRDAERIPEIVQRAFRIAQSGRPGPVVLSLPEDVLLEETMMTFGPAVEKSKPGPSSGELEKIETLLQQARRPLIIAGGGVKWAQGEQELLQFAENVEIPVMAAFRRHDVFPNDHRLYVGHLGLGTNPNLIRTATEADVVIALGTRLSEVTTQDYTLISPDQKLIHIDIDPNVIGRVYAPDIGVTADIRIALKGMMDLNIQSHWSDWTISRRHTYENVSSPDVHPNDPINRHVIDLLQKHLPEGSILTNDAGNFAGWLHTFYQFKHKRTYIGPTSGAMGYGMPAALGAKLANPERTVVSLSGDGGFFMTIQELETAVRYTIPIICIVFNNRMYGTIRMHQEIHYPGKGIGTDLGNVRFAELAKSIGADGYTIHEKNEFESVLREALKGDRPTVMDVITNPEQISVTSTLEDLRHRIRE